MVTIGLVIPSLGIYPNKIIVRATVYFYGPRLITGLVKTKGLPLGAMLVRLCVSDSKRAVAGWRRKETKGHTTRGEGEGGGSRKKEEGPSCWGPGCSGNDRQQAWHRVRPQASIPSGQGMCPPAPLQAPLC